MVDEVLAPAFLVRVDLNANDAGSRVLQQASELLKQEQASDRLQYAWEVSRAKQRSEPLSQRTLRCPLATPLTLLSFLSAICSLQDLEEEESGGEASSSQQ